MPYEQDKARIERRRRFAEALRTQSGQGQMVGPFYVAPPPLAGIAAPLIGAFAERRLDRQQRELEEAERQRLSEALRQMTGSDSAPEMPISQSTGAMPSGALPGHRDFGPRVDPRQQAALDIFRSMPIEAQRQVLGGQALQRLFPPAPKLERVDLGDRIGIVDTSSGQIVRELPKGISPDTRFTEEGQMRRHLTPSGTAVLSAETTRRGQDLDYAATLRGQDISAQTQTANITAEQERQRQEQERKRQNAALRLSNTLDAVNRALELTDESFLGISQTTGAVGRAIRQMPFLRGAGTDALSLARTIDTIKANLSFETLAQMREESKTGGALGQITERELEMLGATVANLDPDMSQEELRTNLQKIRRHLETIAELQGIIAQLRASAQSQTDAQRQAGAQAGTPPDIDALMQQYGVQ